MLAPWQRQEFDRPTHNMVAWQFMYGGVAAATM